MTYRNAKKLHKGDEVLIKATGGRRRPMCCLKVISIEIEGKNVFIYCDDGNTYHHREVM